MICNLRPLEAFEGHQGCPRATWRSRLRLTARAMWDTKRGETSLAVHSDQ